MSLLDTASLILTPNGYKGGVTTGKLYSVKPTNGDGDMVVTRNTTATRVNSAGVIESVAINVPRLDYPPLGGCPSILVEPLRTNKLFESQDISSALWVKSGAAPTITTNIALAPDGTTTADGIQSPDAAASFKTISQAIVVTANSTVTASVFVKKETSETNFGGFVCSFTGVTTKVFRVIVNAVAGTAVISSDSTLTGTTKVEDYGTYWRISATTTDNGSNIALTFLYYGTLSTNGTSTGTGIGSVRTVWGFQLEIDANFTSYIPTTTAQITRIADVITKTGISSLIGQTEGTLFANVIGTKDTLLSSKFILQISGSKSINIAFYSSVINIVSSPIDISVGFTPNVNYKIAIAYSDAVTNNFKVYVNGVPTHTLSTYTGGTFSALSVGCNAGGIVQLNSNINSVQLYQTALTPAQCIALTT